MTDNSDRIYRLLDHFYYEGRCEYFEVFRVLKPTPLRLEWYETYDEQASRLKASRRLLACSGRQITGPEMAAARSHAPHGLDLALGWISENLFAESEQWDRAADILFWRCSRPYREKLTPQDVQADPAGLTLFGEPVLAGAVRVTPMGVAAFTRSLNRHFRTFVSYFPDWDWESFVAPAIRREFGLDAGRAAPADGRQAA